MPSDDRRRLALAALALERNAYCSAVAAALEQVRAMLAAGATADRPDARAALQLGGFAAGRMDAGRFGELFLLQSALAVDKSALRYAESLLGATLAMADDAFCATVAPGGDLGDAIVQSLSNLGRAFSAAHAVTTLRNGSSAHDSGEPLPGQRAPDRWTRGERAIAPPLVVELDGADLRVGGIEEVLQGAQKIVLLVDGTAPPAALVRLIVPGVFVMQCRSIDQLAALSAHDGPGIAAILGEAADFVFDGTRLTLHSAPAKPRRRLGRLTAFQQGSELDWLLQLNVPVAPQRASSMPVAVPAEPGDQLAAWLLKQAKL